MLLTFNHRVQDKMKSLSLQRQAALDEQKKIEEEVVGGLVCVSVYVTMYVLLP